MTFRGDTIAAIATAPGRGGVAIVRVSGPDAFAIAQCLAGRTPEAGRVRFARFRAADGQLLDEGVTLAFKAPHSYTGEDVVEFQCHGGTVTPRRILAACFAAGARLAERGEFTARAFVNGRLGLDAAEGVIELVDAKTERAADSALARLGGERARKGRELYDAALNLSGDFEHLLDVDEGELPPGYLGELAKRRKELSDAIAAVQVRLREGRILRDGALVVLAGAPNAGKSSLLNALLGESRAIVSDVPGTTRDSIEEWLDIGGWPVRIVDTAGLRGTDDALEHEGVERAKALIARADLVLALDCDLPNALRLHAKCDLDTTPSAFPSVLRVSARTHEGLDELKAEIAARLAERARNSDEVPGDDERMSSSLVTARAALDTCANELDPVLAANGVRNCAQILGTMVGAVYSDDLLDTLFSRFCVGK